MMDNGYIDKLKAKISALEIQHTSSSQTIEKYQSAFENSRQALLLFSRGKKLLDVNKQFTRLSLYSKNELLCIPLDTLLPDLFTRYGLPPSEQVTTPPLPLVFDTTLVTQKKTRIPVEISICLLPLKNSPLVFQGVIRDISKTNYLLSRLEKSQEKNIRLSETLNAGISRSTSGPSGRYIEVNQAMVNILGYSRKELFKMNLHTLFTDPSEKTDAFIEPKTGEIREKELSLCHKNGSKVIVSYAGKSVRDTSDGPLYIDEIIYDITRRKTNEEEIQKAEKLQSIGDLAGGIAHNFNNIMMGLYGNIALAKLELSDEAQACAYLEKAENSMGEAIKLTKKLLTFSKGGDPIKETTDIDSLVRDITAFNLSGSNIRPKVDSSKKLWQVHADREQLGLVISNIVKNSRQAMTEGGVLTIGMKNSNLLKNNLFTIARGAYVKITFTDQGPGISRQDLERIFDPYFTTKKNGGGMGLSICYSIVKKHNGHIYASSQLGIGTKITIYLPVISPTGQGEETKAQASILPGSDLHARILVMDDEEHIRNITKRMLEKSGYSVSLAASGEEAIKLYSQALEKKSPFDLVIMDLTIPGGMGGKQASKQILKLDPRAVIIVSSGYSNDPIMSNYKAYGLKGIIPKPYGITDLRDTVHQLLTRT
jgi:two-component system cell cycle sensor histidine kinase/response regulator CckA